MMKDIEIKISRETRMVDLSKTTIGNDGENLQGNLVFSFVDEFVKGQGRLEYVINGESKYAFLLSDDENYYIPIKSVMTKEGQIDMQLVITEGTDASDIPIFKSNVFYVSCKKSINAEIEEEEGYYSWIEIANTKLNEVDEAIEELASQSNYAKEQGDYAKTIGDQLIEDKENGLFKGDQGEPGIQGERGEPGKSGVYVGNEAPTDDSNVWIDLDEEPEEYATKQYVNEMLGVIENGSY